MIVRKIDDEDGKGFYKIFEQSDIEFVDPIKYFGDQEIKKKAILYRDLLHMKNPLITSLLPAAFFNRHATSEWGEKYKEITETAIPPNFISLLLCESKRDQERLLRDQSLTPEQLSALIFRAW